MAVIQSWGNLKMTAIITQNDNCVQQGHFWVSFCEFAQLEATVSFSQPDMIHMIQGSTKADYKK